MATKTPYSVKPSDTIDFEATMGRMAQMRPQATQEIKNPGFFRGMADTVLALGQGVAGSAKSLTDLAGAENAVSQGLDSASKGMEGLKSQESQQARQQHMQVIKAAEESGDTGAEIAAYANMIWDMPAESIAQGVGSFATLGVGKAVQALKMVNAAKAAGMSKEAFMATSGAVDALNRAQNLGFKANIATGAAQGVGAVKGAQYEQTYNNALAKGATPEQASEMAIDAQSYATGGMQQLLGGGLGYLAAKTGPIERLVAGQGAGAGGLMRRVAGGFPTEGLTEGAQGAQERLAGNIAAIDQGVLSPDKLYSGVAGQGVSEGMVGGVLGGGAGAVNTNTQPLAPPSAPADPQTPPMQLGYDPNAGGITVFPDGSAVLNSQTDSGEQAVFDKRYQPQPVDKTLGDQAADQIKQTQTVVETGPMTRAANIATDIKANQAKQALDGFEGAAVNRMAELLQGRADPLAGMVKNANAGVDMQTGEAPAPEVMTAQPVDEKVNPLDFSGKTDAELQAMRQGAQDKNIRNLLAAELQARREKAKAPISNLSLDEETKAAGDKWETKTLTESMTPREMGLLGVSRTFGSEGATAKFINGHDLAKDHKVAQTAKFKFKVVRALADAAAVLKMEIVQGNQAVPVPDKKIQIQQDFAKNREALKGFTVGDEVEFVQPGNYTQPDGSIRKGLVVRGKIEKVDDKEQGRVKVGNFSVAARELRRVEGTQVPEKEVAAQAPSRWADANTSQRIAIARAGGIALRPAQNVARKDWADHDPVVQEKLTQGMANPEQGAENAMPKTANGATKRQKGGSNLRQSAYSKNPLLTLLASKGLFHDKNKSGSLKSEFSPDKQIMVSGFGPVFKKSGLKLDALMDFAVQDGYLLEGASESELYSLIQRAVGGEKISPVFSEQGLSNIEAEYADAMSAAYEEREDQTDAQWYGQSEAEYADALIDELATLSDAELQALDDAVDELWDTPASNTSTRATMEALGFTEQEIQNEERRSAEKADEAAARKTGRGDGKSQVAAQANAGPESGAGQEAQGLSSYTAQQIEQRQAEQDKAEQGRKKQEADAERKAQADAERDTFTLTGSDRPADVAAARGQDSLFDAPAPQREQTPKPRKPNKTQEKEKAREDYFSVGNVVHSYGGLDEVLGYNKNDGAWNVTVHAVKKVGDEWVRVGKPQNVRNHFTQPSDRDLKAGPVDRLTYQAASNVKYTEPRSDGKPFPNAPDRGVNPDQPTEQPPLKVDQELKAIFEGLEGRGLKKKNAEAKLAEHPDAAEAQYVQKHFLDILQDLEDAGKLKINC